MRNIIFIAPLLVLLGSSSALAQQMQARSPRNARAPTIGMGMPAPPSSAMLATTPVPGLSVPGTIPTPTTGVLGAIPLLPGTPASIAQAPVGAITTCTAAPSFSLSASTALISGGLPTPPLPGATIPPNPSFGSSLANGTCNPATVTRDVVEALGLVGVVAPTPGLAPITTPSYGDSTVPLAMTEAGSTGLSPLIDVPSPSPCGTTTMMTTPTTVPTTDPTMATSMTMPMTPSIMMTIPSSTLLTGTPVAVTTPGVSPGC